MDSKKLSVVLPLAITTAILFTGTATLGGITFHSTHTLNIANLKTRSQFNKFLKSELAQKEQQQFFDYFNKVSKFVKSNGKGTLIATKSDDDEYFEFEYYEDKNKVTNNLQKDSKNTVLIDWQAVEQYLKDVEKYDNSDNKLSINSNTPDETQEIEKELGQAKQKNDETAQLFYSRFPTQNDDKVSICHPLFEKLTPQEQNQLNAKHKEYMLAQADWMFINSKPRNHDNFIKIKKAELRMYQLSTEYYEMGIQLYSKLSTSTS